MSSFLASKTRLPYSVSPKVKYVALDSISTEKMDFFLFSDPKETFRIYKTMIRYNLDRDFIQDCVQHAILIRPSQTTDFIRIQTLNALENGCKDTTNNYFRDILISKGLISGELPSKSFKELINPFPSFSVENFIINDDSHKFKIAMSESSFDPSKQIETVSDSPLHFVNKDQNISYMQLIAFYGSINCFKCAIEDSRLSLCGIEKYAIAGGNHEIISILQQKGIKFNNCFEVAVKYHQNDLFDWILYNFECEPIFPSKAIEYFNIDAYNYIIDKKLSNTKEEETDALVVAKENLEKIIPISESLKIDPKYDEAQKEIILLNEGFHIVLAGPGCGKTDLLAERISNAIERGFPPSEMLCLTYTKRAVREIEKRLRQKGVDFNGVFIGTIHSFCNQFLHRRILDQKTADEFVGKNKDIKTYTKDVINMAHMQSLREKRIPERLNSYKIISKSSCIKDGAYKYRKFKDVNDLHDFEDLLLETYHFASENRYGSRKYHWIQVDEIQDLKPLIHEIINFFTADNATVLYLGDDKQTIYSFIGATTKENNKLMNDKKYQTHKLENNYRSPQYLIDIFNKYSKEVLGQNIMLKCKGPNIEFKEDYLGYIRSDDIGKIIDVINMFQKDSPDDKTAVITYTNKVVDDISAVLNEWGMNYFNIALNKVLQDKLTVLVLSHLKIIFNYDITNAWENILTGCNICNSRAEAKDTLKEMKECHLTMDVNNLYLSEVADTYDKGYIIYDTETTGLDVKNDDIVQIAALKCIDSEIIDTFNIIMKTDKKIPYMIKEIINPLTETYKEAKNQGKLVDRKEGFKHFLEFANGLPLIGHNSDRYDFVILDYNLKRYCQIYNLKTMHPVCFDTLKIAKIIDPNIGRYNLKNLLGYWKLEGKNSHLADDDIIGTKSVLDFCMKAFLENRNDHFLCNTKNQVLREQLMNCYGKLYLESVKKFNGISKSKIALINEMENAYTFFGKVTKTHCSNFYLVLDYIQNEINDTKEYTLSRQLNNCIKEIGSFNMSDLFESSSIKEKILISTIHKAKGLEFDNVIIFRSPYKESEDDKRLFYVAMTRAKKRLWIIRKENLPKCIEKDFL